MIKRPAVDVGSSENRLFAAALRESLASGYGWHALRADVLAGLTVGIVALPLAMALAIASGAPPQHGLYTSIVAGAVIALCGGSRLSVSGPTAAFVVVLLPITQQFGLGGLLLTSVLSGLILVALGIARLGRFIELIPYPVIIGFTSGIGVVIATLQVKDLLGLELETAAGNYLDKLSAIASALSTARWGDAVIALLTFSVLLLWPRLKSRIPGHLAALVVGALAAWLLARLVPSFQVATIGSEFSYQFDDLMGSGIPPVAPSFTLPWSLPGPDGEPVGLSLSRIREFLAPAFAVAILGAIESLLCAVVADGMAGTRHNPNSELVGQGLGNLVAPFFGGIPATGAIARTATNVRAGGTTPVAALTHAIVVLLAVLTLAPLLSLLPMAALAALLLMVAWNMSEARHFWRILRVAPRHDVLVLLTCFGLTVLFDMIIAVTVGLGLAAVLFIKRMVDLTESRALVGEGEHRGHAGLPPEIVIYDINGPLFFGAAQKALKVLRSVRKNTRVVILDMSDVPMLDMTGIVAMESIVSDLRDSGISLVISGLVPRMLLKLRRAGVRRRIGRLEFGRDLEESRDRAMRMLASDERKP